MVAMLAWSGGTIYSSYILGLGGPILGIISGIAVHTYTLKKKIHFHHKMITVHIN